MPIGQLLKTDPEYRLVGMKRGGLFRRREVFVHIKDGKLVGMAEVSYGLFGERGSSSGPAHFPSRTEAHDYFTGLGVSEQTYRNVIEPAIPLRSL
ncbi:MAG: hypothetical protein J4469_04390 [Candidatus Aenigmarchaeota archaeon]|nr:hypothetical protein [Candidatus Aenigmarchaeota archaeon]